MTKFDKYYELFIDLYVYISLMKGLRTSVLNLENISIKKFMIFPKKLQINIYKYKYIKTIIIIIEYN